MKSRRRVLQLAAEAEALADAEQRLAARLHQIAHQFVDPAGTHRRADELSNQAKVHRARAQALRASAGDVNLSWGERLRHWARGSERGESAGASKQNGQLST